MTSESILKKYYFVDVDMRNWIESGKDMGYWKTLMNVALNLRVLQAQELVSTPAC
jgi:hypothetical protein